MADENPPNRNRRIAGRLFLSLTLVTLVGLLVTRPWRWLSPAGTALLAVGNVAVFGLFSLAMLRSANARSDWRQARVWTIVAADDRHTTTVLCTDLVARGRFHTLVQQLADTLQVDEPDHPNQHGTTIRVDPPGRENTVHVDTSSPAGLGAARVAVVIALRAVDITRVEWRHGPPRST
ncbi:hypothetical protein O7606_00805 [Micromonospora sp. WMMD882]|uniref:hypothetical protein n=1 Tax=Micromonospora sp. WMMD882 TaxID=3015151 RepID=UPI00248D08DF|nr:hypothetical protein [Micromonospora sp. WMMD882]WBB79982.1 hypothetical protein O7606_00805 [Micromonospora sp. WMMD882]